MKRHIIPWKLISLQLVFLQLAVSCSVMGSEASSFAWIDVPVHDMKIPIGEAINIEGHATDPEGISRVEIWVNDDLMWTLADLPRQGDLVSFTQSWTPTEPGEYLIMAQAVGESIGTNTPDTVIVHVEGSIPETVEVQPTPEPTVEVVTSEEAPLELAVQFWADPPEIEAGACTVLQWEVENAQKIIFGNMEVDPQGSYKACHCESTSYRITVTDLDGIDQVFRVPIQVNGTCATPTPDVDLQAPPAPAQLKPSNGAAFGCIADTILRWQAVSDESGIAQYQVSVERRTGGDWSTAPGSPWTGIGGTEMLISLQCGWEYSWRVRAVDGAGNQGPWSSSWTFNVPLQ